MNARTIFNTISDETKTAINNSATNPSGYRDENYEAAYMECFGGDVITDEQEIIFNGVIETIWRTNTLTQ